MRNLWDFELCFILLAFFSTKMDDWRRQEPYNSEYRTPQREVDRFGNKEPFLDDRFRSSQHKGNLTSKADKKYRSLPVYLRIIFKHSLITGFPEIASSKSLLKRIIKILVFVLCVIGFTYQTLDFLEIYFSYPTVVNVEVSNPFEITQPAITVCNRNRIRRSVFCDVNPKECISYREDMLCKMYERSCPDDFDPPLGVPNSYVYMNKHPKWEFAKNFSHTEKIIKTCSKMTEGEKIPCETPYRKVPAVTTEGQANFCYTIESQWENPDAEESIFPNTMNIFLLLDTEPEEYTIPTEPVKLQFAIHDRRMLVNPYAEGYPLTGGTVYDTYVSMSIKESLPEPYDTNCTDFQLLWKKNGGTGPLNEKMCIELCKLNLLKDNGTCIDKNVAYPHEEKLCATDVNTVKSAMIEKCTEQCGEPCYESTYEVRLEAVNNYDSMCNSPNCKAKNIKMNIYFKRFRITKFKHQAKFASVEMFSYVGGYMGMWLGISLVSLFDLLETLCYLLYYPIGKFKSTALKKRKRSQLMTMKEPNEKLFTVRRF